MWPSRASSGDPDKACAVVDSSACSGSFLGRLHWPVLFCTGASSLSLFLGADLCLDSELEVPGLAFCLCIDMTINKFQYAFTSKRISLIHGMAYYTSYLSHTLFLTCLHKYVISMCFYFVLISYVDIHVLLIDLM